MNKAANRIEFITNLCVIGAALVFVSSLGWLALRHKSSIRAPRPSIAKGTKLTVPDMDWSGSPQTLVLVLSTECKYCTASAPFYRRIVNQGAQAHNTRLIALLPQAPNESRSYLAKLEVKIDTLYQNSLASVGAKGTPTLILVDASGIVIQSWEGLLPPDAESEVLAAVK
jgi:hypothetical protein